MPKTPFTTDDLSLKELTGQKPASDSMTAAEMIKQLKDLQQKAEINRILDISVKQLNDMAVHWSKSHGIVIASMVVQELMAASAGRILANTADPAQSVMLFHQLVLNTVAHYIQRSDREDQLQVLMDLIKHGAAVTEASPDEKRKMT